MAGVTLSDARLRCRVIATAQEDAVSRPVDPTPPRTSEAPPPRSDKHPLNWLLVLPLLATLIPPMFNRIEPTLLGIPFETPPPYVPVDERYPTRPESMYSVVKHLEEELARKLVRWDDEVVVQDRSGVAHTVRRADVVAAKRVPPPPVRR